MPQLAQYPRPAAAVAAPATPAAGRTRPLSPAQTLAAAAVLTVLVAASAHASRAGAGLAWESPTATLVSSLTGPVAMGISTLAIFGTGGALIWGAEIKDFTRTMIMITLIISIIAFATQVLAQLFGAGALVGPVVA